MTEQEIIELIVQGGTENPNVTYEELAQAYIQCLVSLSGKIRQREFLELLSITALLYKKAQVQQAQLPEFARCPMCGK